MSILAEPRRKRKICLDPQNLAWKNDTNKFGHKMLQNMGWNEGQGLGLKNQGMTENIKLKANYTQKGIGAEASDADRTWIAHHDEFSFLLEKLNAKKAAKVAEKEVESEDSEESEEEAEKEEPKSKKPREDSSKSLEAKSKATKTRIHYKFTKMKDLSRYSEKDKSAVIGVGLKSKIVEEEIKEKSPVEKTFEEPATVKNSAVSVTDYFAAKMAKFYAKKNGTEFETPEIKEENIEIIEEETIIVGEEIQDEEVEERLRRKAEKKALKMAKREAEALVENIKIEEEAVIEDGVVDEEEEERRRQKAERKEQRRKNREARALEEAKEEK